MLSAEFKLHTPLSTLHSLLNSVGTVHDNAVLVPEVVPVGRAGPQEDLTLDKAVILLHRGYLRHFLIAQRLGESAVNVAFKVVHREGNGEQTALPCPFEADRALWQL